MTLPVEFLDEIRVRTSLSGLIQRTIPLKKAGAEFRACCPFHNEKSPSFYVNDAKGFYHCFGCSAHGDAIRWLVEQNGLPFIDAVKELAAAAGMEMPARSAGDAQRDGARDRGTAIMARAEAMYRENLWADIGQPTREYLKDRGIRGADARHFGLGYALQEPKGRKSQIEHVLKDVADQDLLDLGLVKTNDDGETYPFFRNRLMIPIHDQRGRVIAFGGRILGDGQPKYLNSPDTPLFDKGRTLFNLHRAGEAARKSGRLVIVEGYMDVIALYRAGVAEAVAPNGTALTPAQLALAWRLTDEPIMCFDGDKAGQRAAHRAAVTALPLLTPGKSLRFVSPPAGKDPDDVLREGGPEAIAALLTTPRPLFDLLWTAEVAAEPLETPEQRAGLQKRLRDHVNTIKDEAVQDAYASEFQQRYETLTTGRRAPPKRGKSEAARPMALRIEAALVEGMMRYPDVVVGEIEMISGIQWRSSAVHKVVTVIVDNAMSNPEPDAFNAAIAARIAEHGLTDVLLEIRAAATLPFAFTSNKDPREARMEMTQALLAMPRS